MNSIDREFINSIIEATDEEFEAMMDCLSTEEIAEVLTLVQQAKSELMIEELEEIDAQVCEDNYINEAAALLCKYTLK